jgi:hypothetical protein
MRRLDELVLLSGVSATAAIGTPTFSLDCRFVVTGNVITSANGDVVVTTTVFPYDADAFDRNRIVYVEEKTSADSRIIVVGEQPRIVFIEAHSTVFDRRVNV